MKFLVASITMNNKRMDDCDVSASLQVQQTIFHSLIDHLVSTSIDAYAAIITAHLPPDTPSAKSI